MANNGILVVSTGPYGEKRPEQQAGDPVAGDLVYFDGSTVQWERVAAGTQYQLLQTNGTALAPSYTSQKLYPPAATNPVSPAPADGDLYYNTSLNMLMEYDGSRTKWLSVETASLPFGRNNNTGAGAFFRSVDRVPFTATRGREAEFAGTFVSIAASRSDSDVVTIEATINGASAASTQLTLGAGITTNRDVTLNSDFVAGDILGARNAPGGNGIRNTQGWLRYKYRVV